MYSEEDINSAVAAGALTPDAAAAFRAHMTRVRAMPRSDEEGFRLVNSFNDIFVAIAIVIMLVAAGAIGQALAGAFAPEPVFPVDAQVNNAAMDAWARQNAYRSAMSRLFSGLLVAATAWPLAEVFTRRRRMALPSILLLLAFVGGVFAAFSGVGDVLNRSANETTGALMISGAGLVAAGAAWLHWRRFMVPITVAAGVGALALTVLSLIAGVLKAAGVEDTGTMILWLVFLAGLAIFAFAMRWDMSDRARTTRRSDVAFWLHLLAAPMIAHPIFYSLGIMDGGDEVGVGAALVVVAIYVLFGLVALVIDRRALLVSALAYVLAALGFLFDRFGAVELNVALTALVIGSALLMLSAFWTSLRSRLVMGLPAAWQERVPPAMPVMRAAPALPA
ncbi:hypothetical protein EYB45_00910 [Erythrobacteraceae bacterium CFH 75059]|uniref:hypothetical protein n=1 Tax=Qipengyuania thermophila TaxID=2509361 RepID=UPI001021A599|nr:hypothetical protein [Qipengyuania thermophila]TCD06328.1 hypothetical protein EYB45_00910 [Erythrobacteraceae bacterium CFH 75059]